MDEAVKKPSRRILNAIGALGYSLLIFTYVIVAGVVLLWAASEGHLAAISLSTDPAIEPGEIVDKTSQTSLLMTVLTYIITAFIALTVVFVMITLPYWLGKSGAYMIRRALELLRINITPLTLFVAKFIACSLAAVPILVILASDINNIVIALAILTAIGISFVLFILQHYLAKVGGLKAEDIW